MLRPLILLSMLCAACAPPVGDTAVRPPGQLDPAVVALVDSAADAYRAGDYQEARDRFHIAAQRDTSLAASWFGLFMTERALGNREAADSALRRARRLADAPGRGRAP